MRRRLRLGINAWLILLSLFSAIPIVLFSGFTIYRLGVSQQNVQISRLSHRAVAAAVAVEQRLAAMSAMTRGLALSDAALQGDVPALYRQATRLLKVAPEARLITLIDAEGRQIFNTAVPLGSAIPPASQGEVVRRVFSTGLPVVSDLYTGVVVAEPTISINVPVSREGRVVYCLRMSVLVDIFSQALRDQAVPPGWTVALISQSGVIIARNHEAEQFVGERSRDDIFEAIASRREGVFDSVTHEGTQVKTLVQRIPEADWAVVIGAPVALLNAGLMQSLWAMGIGGALLVMVGMAASLWLARHLARQVSDLAVASTTLDAGEERRLPATLIRELDEMGAALGNARSREIQVCAELSESKTTEAMLARLVEELRLSQAQVIQSAGRFQALLKTASDGIHTLDEHGNLLETSDSFLRMLGYEAHEMEGMAVGDWYVDFHPDTTLASLRFQVEEQEGRIFEAKFRRRDGTVFDVEISCRGVHVDGMRYLYAAARDITERKTAEAKIQQLAFYDSLTHLPNRRLLLERLTQAKALVSRNGTHGAVAFFDVDNFKILNDTLGHRMGDLLLAEIAGRLKACVRDTDTVARFGGDEFVIVLEDLSGDVEEAALRADGIVEKVLEHLAEPYQLENHLHFSTVSLGVTLFHDKDVTNDDLLRQADLAMYQAKAGGRNTRRFFDPKMQAGLAAQSALESDLRAALENKESLVLHYQPQVDRRGGLIGAEGLLRWRHPVKGIVQPDEFIPLAEASGLILALGTRVIAMACDQLAAWSRDPVTSHLALAINVSARQFRHPGFIGEVEGALARSKIDPRLLKLELTESLLLQEMDDAVQKMRALENLGVSLSLDDFGTGYSSLAYLKRLPLSQIKIDRSFVRDILVDANDATIAKTIIVLGKSLGLSVIAEGVEEPGQWRFLHDEGCDQAQGFLFGRPMPAEEFLVHVRQRSRMSSLSDGLSLVH
ncbi:EAL domain-containing protein [Telmatospirillum siberiense]|uniref:Uncharacterized protein n=1 Tax=Telmatospirillum siberiense TaxID=382514 RepID=A0A2N3Q111_9PROT|nr:EAL domain-containing protein [Telmatospirillum siberiense]PKU26360.1 hypothetical protein CWS72_00465 [Telmatospirillum siberiense]